MRQRLRLDRSQHCHAARFPAIGMPLLADDRFIAAPAMCHQCNQVRLRAGGRKQRRFEVKHVGRKFLQAVDGRIVAEHIVAQRRIDHRLFHCCCRLRHRVATEITHIALVLICKSQDYR